MQHDPYLILLILLFTTALAVLIRPPLTLITNTVLAAWRSSRTTGLSQRTEPYIRAGRSVGSPRQLTEEISNLLMSYSQATSSMEIADTLVSQLQSKSKASIDLPLLPILTLPQSSEPSGTVTFQVYSIQIVLRTTQPLALGRTSTHSSPPSESM